LKPRHVAALALVGSITVICLAGCCVTTKKFVATGGSRGDGVVILSYEDGPLQVSHGDYEQGLALARSTCIGWGYSGAIRYGESEQCITHGWEIPDLGEACKELVKDSYHCLGAATLPKP
jgi:hypothetical protein